MPQRRTHRPRLGPHEQVHAIRAQHRPTAQSQSIEPRAIEPHGIPDLEAYAARRRRETTYVVAPAECNEERRGIAAPRSAGSVCGNRPPRERWHGG